MTLRVLHFADAHIDMANYGRHDPETGLPLRVMDFLKSLDTIVDTAINEKVDLVLFAGDAYKDRTPAPTFQREWGKRIMRLSKAAIPTLLLVGNHDLSPAIGRAHAIEEFSTLEVPHVCVIDRPVLLTPDLLEGLPLQILAIPWISRSGMMAHFGLSAAEPEKLYEALEQRLTELINGWFDSADSSLPTILAAHISVQGALFGAERAVMLGEDLVLPASLVRDSRLDYVALGHIHKPQNLNGENCHPPAIYPGSIERIDFGEARDEKFFVIANIDHGHTEVEWRQLTGIRPFIDLRLRLVSQDNMSDQLRNALPAQEDIKDAIVRLTLEYPRDWEDLIDESLLREQTSETFEFHLAKHPQMPSRIRLPDNAAIGSLPPMELLNLYWKANHADTLETKSLNELAESIIREAVSGQ